MDELRFQNHRRLLQVAVGLACLVPIVGGAWGIWRGTDNAGGIDLDSHYRYLSGLLLGIGLSFAATIPHIDRHAARFRLLTFIVVAGGLSRLVALALAGMPSRYSLLAMSMEIIVTPLLCWWQNRLAGSRP